MSPHRCVVLTWVLVGVSLASLGALQWALVTKWDRWEAWPFAALAHGAMLPAVAACGLSWRLPGRTATRALTTVLAVVLVLAWSYTWLVPLQLLVIWISRVWYLWMVV
jgi:hypothetical protein